MLILHSDLKAFLYCNKGTKAFFKRHNLDWQEFVFNGLDENSFIGTGDAMALALVDFARSRHG